MLVYHKKISQSAGRQRQGSRRISGSSVSTLCVVEPLRISCWKPNEMQTACLMVRVQPIYANNISSRAADEARRVNTMSAACIYWLIFAILWCLGTNCSQAVLKSGKLPPPPCSFRHKLHTRSPQGWCNAGFSAVPMMLYCSFKDGCRRKDAAKQTESDPSRVSPLRCSSTDRLPLQSTHMAQNMVHDI